MNSALWQASWGYYLSNLIGFGGLHERLTASSATVCRSTPAWARDHFVTHVRSCRAISDSALRAAAIRRAAGYITGPVDAAWRPNRPRWRAT